MSQFKNFSHGLFEILLPGSFLLLNIMAFVYIVVGLPVSSQVFQNQNQFDLVEIVPLLGAAYILGMLLRLCRTEFPDRLSGFLIRCTRRESPEEKRHLKEVFWYCGWMREKYVANLPQAVSAFFEVLWAEHYCAPMRRKRNANSQFYNFMKSLIQVIDKDAAEQLRNAEAVSRFTASSFWALVFCALMTLLETGIFYLRNDLMASKVAFGIFVCFSVVLFGITRFFRYLRIKEACMVFDFSFAHRKTIYELLEMDVSLSENE